MSFFDGKIEWSAENDQFREMLEKLREEVKTDGGLAYQISDDVFSEIGAEAIEAARQIPLKQSTIERRARALKPKTKRRKRKQKRTDRMRHLNKGGTNPFDNDALRGAVAAVSSLLDDTLADPGRRTREHKNAANARSGGLPVAYREIGAKGIVWGSKRWVDYLHPHIFGTKHMPARLSLLQPDKFAAAATPRIKDVMASWLGERLEKAGAPVAWIQEITEGHF